MPRRSSAHMARDDEAVGLQARDDARERALAQVDGLGQVLHPALVLLARREALEDLVLADAQAVLVQRALQRGRRPRVAVEQVAPGVDEAGVVLRVVHGAPHYSKRRQFLRSHLMHTEFMRLHVFSLNALPLLLLHLLLVVLCGVLFLDGLDVSMVGVALPSIEADLHLTTSQLQWIVSGYVLGYGGLLLLGGRTADLLGRRRTLLIALGVFTVASALGGLVDDGTLLVVTRFLKGAAAAFTAPAGLSIITTTFAEGPERNRALSIYTA